LHCELGQTTLERVHLFSGLLRNYNARSPTNETILVTPEIMESFDVLQAHSPIQIPNDFDIVCKTEAVMHAIRGRSDGRLNHALVCEEATAYPIGFCRDASEFRYLIQFAKKQEWIDYTCRRTYPDKRQPYELRLTPKGWAKLTGIGDQVTDQGFIAMAFRAVFADEVLRKGLVVGIVGAGYNPMRIDSKEHSNRIDDEIVAEIRKSRFVVADLTGKNAGAYFEAGFAMGLGKPVIWTCQQTDIDTGNVHFDTRQYSIVPWTPNEWTDFAKRLTQRIEATLGRGRYKPS
jgi:hypothetical protein